MLKNNESTRRIKQGLQSNFQPRMDNNKFHQVGQKGQPVKRFQKGKKQEKSKNGYISNSEGNVVVFLTLEMVETRCDLLLRTGGKNSYRGY